MKEIKDFKASVRAWLEANCPPSMRTPPPEGEMVLAGSRLTFSNPDQRLWFERMREQGWFAPDWPREYGGGGLDARQTRVLETELSRLKCRAPMFNLGIWMIGPVLLEFGSDEQKARHLPGMARGEVAWCQGFSEPGAGSDLAGLSCRAERDGDHYVVNGSKIWTSYADRSDWMYALVRTDMSAGKHAGISMLLIDMASAGVSTRPIELISGKSHFCQVFFDNVRVPVANLVGAEGDGWMLAKALLAHERRAMSKFGDNNVPGVDFLDLARRLVAEADPDSRAALADRVAACAMDEHAYKLTLERTHEAGGAGQDVSALVATFKYVHSEQNKTRYRTLTALAGTDALGWEGEGYSEELLKLARQWLNAYTYTVAGGTSEIQLNILARRVLGLPDSGG
ncbi:acyl-CoA dehydrogenase family protein [Crenobacter intestini]|uniref:Acyl-CoA dehydrogenase n=1 Tax=Crenobacter intestini TaxID=2563443 RepID=A0A4T0UMX5_9NEIS|nr:acyl-CoA dehydrogenase family protein [Crenobacter intestini]TIC79821.1 acyl-CoA dehydrogenase [Crenobacter intestini]